jgi:peptidoglycan/LPS O-acetylase OafA/YrhL
MVVILGTECMFFVSWPFKLSGDLRAPLAFWLAVSSLLLGGYEILLRKNRSAAALGSTLFAFLAAAAVGPEGAPGGTGGEIISLVLVVLLLLVLLPATLKVGFRAEPAVRPLPPVGDAAGDDQEEHRRDEKRPKENFGDHLPGR